MRTLTSAKMMNLIAVIAAAAVSSTATITKMMTTTITLTMIPIYLGIAIIGNILNFDKMLKRS